MHTVPMLHYPIPVLNEMVTQVAAFGSQLQAENNESIISVNAKPDPFISAFAHSKGGAYPHSPSRPLTPAAMAIIYQIPNATVPLGELILQSCHGL